MNSALRLAGFGLTALLMGLMRVDATGQTLALSGRLDEAVVSSNSDRDGSVGWRSVPGFLSTNQIVLNAGFPMVIGEFFGTVNTKIGPGFTDIGSRGAEVGFKNRSFLVSAGQSLGTEFSWLTATSPVGNAGLLDVLSAFPKRSVRLQYFFDEYQSVKMIRHLSQIPKGGNYEHGSEFSFVREVGDEAFRIAIYQRSETGADNPKPFQIGLSWNTSFGNKTRMNFRTVRTHTSSGWFDYQVGIGFVHPTRLGIEFLSDLMRSISDGPTNNYTKASVGLLKPWLQQNADIYAIGYAIRNQAMGQQSLALLKNTSPGGDSFGMAFGIRLRFSLLQ